MPINTRFTLSLETHVYPILEDHGMNPRWNGEWKGSHEGILVNEGYISICSGDHLYVTGSQRLAEFLLKHIQPLGKELVIDFTPQEEKDLPGPDNRTTLMRLSDALCG